MQKCDVKYCLLEDVKNTCFLERKKSTLIRKDSLFRRSVLFFFLHGEAVTDGNTISLVRVLQADSSQKCLRNNNHALTLNGDIVAQQRTHLL